MSVKKWIKEKCDKAEESLKNFGANATKFIDDHPRLLTVVTIGGFIGLPLILGLALPPSESSSNGENEKEETKSNFDQICDFISSLDIAPGESYDISIGDDGVTNVNHTYKPVIEADTSDIYFTDEPIQTIDVEA